MCTDRAVPQKAVLFQWRGRASMPALTRKRVNDRPRRRPTVGNGAAGSTLAANSVQSPVPVTPGTPLVLFARKASDGGQRRKTNPDGWRVARIGSFALGY
jgi:hypothetical protein